MKIRQLGESTGDIISDILRNRNIENLERFLNPTNENDTFPFDILDMKYAAERILAHIKVRNKICVLVDPDADGFTSSTIICQVLRRHDEKINLHFILHDTKAHGLTEKVMEKIAEEGYDLIIVPDAGTNDTEAILRISFMGTEVVIIDHHEIERRPTHCILVNNQDPENNPLDVNKNLVGAGMSLKFCQALDLLTNNNFSEDYFDLAMIGQIGDGSDISENEVRNLIFKGLAEFKNPFVRAVLKDSFSDLSLIAPIDLSFSIIPLINAVVRVGTYEEKQLLFEALNSIGSERTWDIPKKKKNKVTGKFDTNIIHMNLYEYTLDIIKKVKARQATMVKNTMAEIMSNIDNSGGIAICVIETSNAGSITGLVANKIASKLRKPTLIVHHIKHEEVKNLDEEVEIINNALDEDTEIKTDNSEKIFREPNKYVGSGRGYEKVLPSLKDWCQETELVEFAQGHANAFGISIFEKDFEKFKERLKNVEEHEFIYDVDLISRKVDKNLIIEVDKHKKYFGGKVFPPLLALMGIQINKQFIRQKGSMLTFFEAGVEFVMYSAPEGLYDELTTNFERFITMNFVGKPTINNWNGRETVQIVIEDCERVFEEVKEVKEVTADTLVF